MKIRRGVFRLPGAFLLLLTGCAQPFTGETLRAVQETVTFEKVLDNPRAYKGSVILWGGVIRKSTGQPGETNLLIIQSPLDSRRVPQTDKTQGEFIAPHPGQARP
ncbi:MAG TPA: Slp family lipoprotein [Thermodesulfobacteriota bacterium]|nr:Slp family lipoprotein [Thermodesulfobacteriota bacterium]